MENCDFNIARAAILLVQKQKAPDWDADSNTPIFRIAIWMGRLCQVLTIYFWIALFTLQRIGAWKGLDKSFPQVASRGAQLFISSASARRPWFAR